MRQPPGTTHPAAFDDPATARKSEPLAGLDPGTQDRVRTTARDDGRPGRAVHPAGYPSLRAVTASGIIGRSAQRIESGDDGVDLTGDDPLGQHLSGGGP